MPVEMTHEEFMLLCEKIQQLAEIVGKFNGELNACIEALLVLRKIMDLQDQRLDNLEDFMHKMTGGKPNPIVGVPPSQ